MVSDRKRGLSLLETTIAVYVMAATLLVVIGLFHSGIKARQETYQRKRATAALRGAHSQLLAFSQKALGTEYGFDQIKGWGAQVQPVVTDPDFEVTFEVAPQAVMAVSSSFEQRFSASQHLELGERLKVLLTVRGLDQTVNSVCWLSDPPRALHPTNPLRITQTGPSPLPPYSPPGDVEEILLAATLYDQYDQPIPSATFVWGVLPVEGNATIVWEQDLGDRSGRTARLQNWTTNYDGRALIQAGTIQVECRTRYRGREISATVGPVLLAP